MGKKPADILEAPHISEKAMMLSEEDKYVFKVKNDANKPEIRKAIEKVYDVDVTDVKTMNMPSKPRSVRGNTGEKQGFKKAIVQLKKGQRIDILPT